MLVGIGFVPLLDGNEEGLEKDGGAAAPTWGVWGFIVAACGPFGDLEAGVVVLKEVDGTWPIARGFGVGLAVDQRRVPSCRGEDAGLLFYVRVMEIEQAIVLEPRSRRIHRGETSAARPVPEVVRPELALQPHSWMKKVSRRRC